MLLWAEPEPVLCGLLVLGEKQLPLVRAVRVGVPVAPEGALIRASNFRALPIPFLSAKDAKDAKKAEASQAAWAFHGGSHSDTCLCSSLRPFADKSCSASAT